MSEELAPRECMVWQEFYCNDCAGYIRLRLNAALDFAVVIVCPSCGRRHPRILKYGRIFDTYNQQPENLREEICPQKSAYSKTPFSVNIEKNARNGEIITEGRDPMYERWFEMTGRD